MLCPLYIYISNHLSILRFKLNIQVYYYLIIIKWRIDSFSYEFQLFGYILILGLGIYIYLIIYHIELILISI